MARSSESFLKRLGSAPKRAVVRLAEPSRREEATSKEARPTAEPNPQRWGICCSGGGIRSASYCLGALQVLREEGVLERATYVSAVSGGSYIASAIAAAASDASPGGVPPFAPGSPEERHLRNNSSYMAPDVAGKTRLTLRVVAGALWHLVLVVLVAIVVALPASWAYAAISDQLAGDRGGFVLHDVGLWLGVAALPLVLALALNLELWKADERRHIAERLSWYATLAAAAAALVLVVIPQGVLATRAAHHVPLSAWLPHALGTSTPHGAGHGAGLLSLLGGGAAVTAIWSALSTFASRERRILMRVAAFAAGPVIVLAPVLAIVDLGAAHGFHVGQLAIVGGAAAALGLVEWKGDLNQWSLHPFYRRRLISAFYAERRGRTTATTPDVGEDHERRLIDLVAHEPDDPVTTPLDPVRFPRLVVCAAANVTEPGATPPGRAAMPFIFTSRRAGVPGRDAGLARYDPRLSLPKAVAVSGAAVSPLMGKKTVRAVRFLLALMNVRLGVWLPNPEPKRPRAPGSPCPPPRAHLLVKEMLGVARVDDPYIYVTDGGHFDNLGLVELLRRGCTTVFCLDGGGDPPGSFRALGEAVALARSELQVDVEVDPTPLTPLGDDRLAERGYAQGTLRYRSSPTGEPLGGDVRGRIVYCRAAVTADAPWDVRDFANRDKQFPFHSTMDQLFTDEKFESYRALGAHTARRAVRAWRAEALRESVMRRLCECAAGRTTVTYAELVDGVRAELAATEGVSLRPLLDEIAAREDAARRPPLTLVVQDGRPNDAAAEQLEAVYTYWAPLPAASA